MLRLNYTCKPAGAPDTYGTADDTLKTEAGDRLQLFRKSTPGAAEPSAALASHINDWLRRRRDARHPVIVMVHGYLYDPDEADTHDSNPRSSVFGTPPAVHPALSWLPIVGECDDAGSTIAETAIGFAYTSHAGRPEVGEAGWNQPYQYAVFDQSPLAARALATVLRHLGTTDARVRILAHSLGTRTTSQAIGMLGERTPGNIDRIVLLNGAEFSVDAAANFRGRKMDVLNICSRADAVLKLGGDTLCHPIRLQNSPAACVIGRDGLAKAPRWLDLQLDSDALQHWFAEARAPNGTAYQVSPHPDANDPHRTAKLAHWCCYTGNGNRALVRDLLLHPAMTVAGLREAAVPEGNDSPMHGRFSNVAIPPTPVSRADRRIALDTNGPVAGGAGN